MSASLSIPHPEPGEYAPAYAPYLAALEGTDPFLALERQPEALRHLLGGLSTAQQRHRYAPGKWSVREVVGHVGDAEQIFGYRLLRIARGDVAPLPGFDENDYVAASGYDTWDVSALLGRVAALRQAHLLLIHRLDASALQRMGEAGGYAVSARALVWILAGHAAHHEQILRERYLPG